MKFTLTCLFTIFLATAASAQDSEPQGWEGVIGALNKQTGTVTVQGDKVTIDLPEGWQYYHQKEARFIVEEAWGNPPDGTTLGLVTLAGFEMDDGPQWAVVVSYDDEGHVEDSDAATTDFNGMLASMQEGVEEANKERAGQGYEPIKLLGWAEPPHYDSAQKKLYWARNIQFGAAGDPNQSMVLNYDVRVLGRRGTLVMSAVAGPEDLAEVTISCKELLATTQFVAGERYEDYQEGIDPVVAGGIGALIAGKLLLKGGILKFLLALWKPLAIGLVVVGGFFVKMLGGRKSSAGETLA